MTGLGLCGERRGAAAEAQTTAAMPWRFHSGTHGGEIVSGHLVSGQRRRAGTLKAWQLCFDRRGQIGYPLLQA